MVDQEGWDEGGRRALGRADWVCAGRMCPGQADVLALLPLPMQGALPSAEQTRQEFLLHETELSEGVRRVKYSACVSSDVVMLSSCHVMQLWLTGLLSLLGTGFKAGLEEHCTVNPCAVPAT